MYFGKSEDPDEMQHTFHQGLHCLLRLALKHQVKNISENVVC